MRSASASTPDTRRWRVGFSIIEAAIALVLVAIVLLGVGKILVAVIGGGLRADDFWRGAWEGAKDSWVALVLVGGAVLLVIGPVGYALIADALERRRKASQER